MLTIRLTRKGKKNQPFFRVVVIDKKRSSKGGRVVEDLGYKNPLTKKVSINKERVLYWIKNGAQPSATVHNLLVAEKIIEGKKIHVSKISKKKQAEIDKAKKVETDKTITKPSQSPAGNEAGDSEDPKPAEISAEAPTETPALVEEVKEEPKTEDKPVEPTSPEPVENSVDNENIKEAKPAE